MANELDLIERWRQRSQSHAAVDLGIGDDTAILRTTSEDPRSLVTVDLLAEGTHFTIPPATPRQIGRKALGVNLSDIAAMAGRPEAAFVALLLPRSRGSEFANELMEGLTEFAAEFGVAIAGGDTNVWDGPLVVSVTLTGSVTSNGPVLRAGAQAGDWLFVTGPLGGSMHGRHLRVMPRVREAHALAEAVHLHAMIDLSDGLSRDVRYITVERGLGFEIEADAIPIHADVPATLPADRRLSQALSDGEDFELLFAVGPEDGATLLESGSIGISATLIGKCTADASVCRLLHADGTASTLAAAGFEHCF